MQLGLKHLVFLIAALSATSAVAETIEFPEEELARESVLPIFDKTVVVRERAVKTAGKFEVNGGLGINLAEPLYATSMFNLGGTYHFDEIHGANVAGYFLTQGLSSAGEDLKDGKGLRNGNTFDASLAPTVESMFFGNYQFTAYYGKTSVTKQTTMNLALYGLLGVGLINWSDATTIGFSAGAGQKLYFSPNLALRVDLFLTMYQGPDPTSPKAPNDMDTGGPALESDDFDTTFYFRPYLSGSLAYMF